MINRPIPNFPADVIGRSVFRVVHPDYVDCIRENMEKVIRTGEVTEYEAPGLDGATYSNRIAPVKYGDEIAALTVSSIDVTQQ